MHLSLAFQATLQNQVISDLLPRIDCLISERFSPKELEDISNVFQRIDTTEFIENILNLVNRSNIIFDVLDLVAYNPDAISLIADTVTTLVAEDWTELSETADNIPIDLDYTILYEQVMSSGILSSLLDGILLDKSYRPVLVRYFIQILKKNKNLLNYMVHNLFEQSKRDESLSISDLTATLESFSMSDLTATLLSYVNIFAAPLNSDLAERFAFNTLVALNNTQFLTHTVKRILADEGYQNMTAQLAIDFFKSGVVVVNGELFSTSDILEAIVSAPSPVEGIVKQVLSGNFHFPALGKYAPAVKEILQDIENSGTFAELKRYFSENHSVSTPLIPTGQIVTVTTASSLSLLLLSFSNSSNSSAAVPKLGAARALELSAVNKSSSGGSGALLVFSLSNIVFLLSAYLV